MFQAGVITVIVLVLAGLAAWSLRHRAAVRRDAQARLSRASPEQAWRELLAPHAGLEASLRSLFQDEDYRWLRGQPGLAEAARSLKRRRIRLARRYLGRLRSDFNVLLAIHGELARSGRIDAEAQDRVAALALRFQFKIALALGLLPWNHLHLNLAPLRGLGALAAGWPGLPAQAEAVPVPRT
jgi:hypothetical protein